MSLIHLVIAIDALMELSKLIRKTVGDESWPATEYIDGDADLPVCAEFVAETWEDDFLQSLTEPDNEQCDDESDGEDMDIFATPSQITELSGGSSYKHWTLLGIPQM